MNEPAPSGNITAEVKDMKRSDLIPAVPLELNYQSNVNYTKLVPIPPTDEVKYSADDRLHATKSKFFDSISSDTSDGKNLTNLRQMDNGFGESGIEMSNNKFYESWKKGNDDK